jgi:hypothetical protein
VLLSRKIFWFALCKSFLTVSTGRNRAPAPRSRWRFFSSIETARSNTFSSTEPMR